MASQRNNEHDKKEQKTQTRKTRRWERKRDKWVCEREREWVKGKWVREIEIVKINSGAYK